MHLIKLQDLRKGCQDAKIKQGRRAEENREIEGQKWKGILEDGAERKMNKEQIEEDPGISRDFTSLTQCAMRSCALSYLRR